MSDTSGTILKIIASIASPKAAVKFISIAIFLSLSWSYLNSAIESLGAPSEHKSLVMLFLALGVGSLIGELINYLGVAIHRHTLGKYLKAKEERLTELEKIKRCEKILTHFKLTYKHFSFSTKEVLWDLSVEPQSIWDDSESNFPFRSLLDNGYIKQISNLNEHEGLYKLHPDIAEYLRGNIEKEVGEVVDCFLNKNRENKNILVKTITSRDYLPKLTYSEFSEISRNASPVILFSVDYDHDDNSFSNTIKGFEISLNKYFESNLGERLQGSLFTRRFKVNGEEIAAT